MPFKPLLAAVAIAASAATFDAARAATRVGTLECNVGAGVGLIVTSDRSLNCLFRGNRGVEHYVGSVRRFGLDVGVTGAGRLVWGVFADTRPGRGALTGDYAGASGAISAGVGVGANALVGGSDHAFSLQPLSVEAQTGVNLALGVGDLRLDYAPAGPRRHRRR